MWLQRTFNVPENCCWGLNHVPISVGCDYIYATVHILKFYKLQLRYLSNINLEEIWIQFIIEIISSQSDF